MQKLKVIAGPCVIEEGDHVFRMAEALRDITDKFSENIDFYFKASFDKANRTKLDSYRGPGFRSGILMLDRLREKVGVKVTTDFHTEDQIQMGAHYVDVVQIPAFLSRQTDLLVAAGRHANVVNIKKGQFMSWEDMTFAERKVRDRFNTEVWFTERGTQYGDVTRVDFDKIYLKAASEVVIMDCTHPSNGYNQLLLARLGLMSGCNGIFMEVHDNPKVAKCDGAKSVRLDNFSYNLRRLIDLWEYINEEV
jgi:2-dehydro-3-deoxyphosphooctonate aldolase (KDO 8-P synthase)